MDFQKFGNFVAKMLVVSWHTRFIARDSEKGEAMERTLGSAIKWLSNWAAEEVKESSFGVFYSGVAQGISQVNVSFASLIGLFSDLPGNPRFEEVWRVNNDEIVTGKVFVDKRENRSFRALNETGELFIKSTVDQFRQFRQQRERREQQSNSNQRAQGQ